MKILLPTLCLINDVLLGSARMSDSADFQRGLNAYNSEDLATALSEFAPLAEQGNALAKYNLGYMYKKGLGVQKSFRGAIKIIYQRERPELAFMSLINWGDTTGSNLL